MLIALLLVLPSLKGSESVRSCQSNVCLNGGTCEVNDEERSFRCVCLPSFTGVLCESELRCSRPCQNGGQCIADATGEYCKCPKDYSGDLCEVGSLDCTVQGCAPGERCVRMDGGSAICVEDVCFPNPCLNNANCTANDEGFSCTCTSGFEGRLCSHDIDECVIPPCEHGAECVNTVGSFSCLCPKGYRGKLCEEQFFCDLDPCLNGGTCKEDGNGYHCICPQGFSSENCQEKFEENCNCSNPAHICIDGKCACPSGFMGERCDHPLLELCNDTIPCLNGGTCASTSNSCICVDGYTGLHCEEQLTCTVQGKQCLHGKCNFAVGGNFCECENGFKGLLCDEIVVIPDDPCRLHICNLGKCENRDGVAVCICPEGTTGEFCEGHDVCAKKPCMNGGRCSPIGTNLSQFICICEEGFSGLQCEVNESHVDCDGKCAIDEICQSVNGKEVCVKIATNCDQCINSVRCVKYDDRHVTCICDPQWDGVKCDRLFEGCRNMSCESHEMCRMERNKIDAKAECHCASGLGGMNCSTTTAATFKASSFFLHQSSTLMIGSSLAPYFLKFSFRTSLRNTHIVTAENILNQMQFVVELHDGLLYANFSTVAFFPFVSIELNDDRWYTVVIKNMQKRVFLEMHVEDFVVRSELVDEKRDMGIFWTRFGKDRDVNFRGCLRDVQINDEAVDLVNSRRSIGIKEGCHRERQCRPNPCENGGTCIDEWDAFLCDCARPFLPPHCLHKLSEVTLGHSNISSKIEFFTGNDAELIKLHTDLSLLIRTNKPNGALLYIGEKEQGSENVATFISLAVLNGSLQAKSSLGTKRVFGSASTQSISDNTVHLLRLIRKANNITVLVDGIEWMGFEVENRFDHPLLADSLVVGSADGVREEAFDTDDYFKGTVQDLRINDRSVVLSPIPADVNVEQFGTRISEENVIEGTVSDDVCGERSRCENGKCVNTFNDFECVCDFSWMGRTCNSKDHCALAACPSNVQCTNFDAGYICSLPATFVMSSSVTYSLEGVTERSLPTGNFSFSIRTRSISGQILYLQSEGNSLSISLDQGMPILEIIFQTQPTVVSIASSVNDGQWHTITISDTIIWFDHTPKQGIAKPLHMETLLAKSNAVLVVGKKDASSQSFDGCLKDVQIGPSAPVSFFENEKSGGFINGSLRFVQSKRINILDDCQSEEMCGVFDPCKNSATCNDLWNLRKCECPVGFVGDLCEHNINECESHKCVHGECVDGIGEFRCSCYTGYTGEYCEHKIDYCHPSPCLNGGSCIARNSSAVCTCATGFFGARCQQNVTATCTNSPCENGAKCIEQKDSFSCQCADGFEGALCDIAIDHCGDNPCKNGGQCTSNANGYECLCALGYTGKICNELKDECEDSPCSHGNCRSVWNGFVCECEQGWKGPLCDTDVDECERFPCENGANCTNLEGTFSCSCPSYYLGDHCEIEGSCLSLPCGDRGECIQRTVTEHSCLCIRGYTGTSCEQEIDYCISSPCQNGATCQRLIGDFKCNCIAGFTGEVCSTDIDECVNDACLNGGRCTDRVNGFDCECNGTGYEGVRCEVDIDECKSNICVHGTCNNLPGSYECECPEGYIGRRCNLEDPCLPDSLNRTRHSCIHGQCVRPVVVNENGRDVAKHECECYTGYTGIDCEQLQQRPRSVPLSYVAGPLGVLIIALLLLGCALFAIVTVRSRRAIQGTYSPSHQEYSGPRVPMNSVLKAPPEERLI